MKNSEVDSVIEHHHRGSFKSSDKRSLSSPRKYSLKIQRVDSESINSMKRGSNIS